MGNKIQKESDSPQRFTELESASVALTTMIPDYQLPTELCCKSLTSGLRQHCHTGIQLGTKWR